MEKYLREMEIESLFISCQSPIARLLDRCDAPWLQWICTISPYPIILSKKSCMMMIKMKGVDCMCIMCTTRMTKAIVNYNEVMELYNCL